VLLFALSSLARGGLAGKELDPQMSQIERQNMGLGRIWLMARDLRKVFEDALEFLAGDRARLAGLLIRSLDPPSGSDVEELWAAEAERRWLEIESGAVRTIPWEEVRIRLFRGWDRSGCHPAPPAPRRDKVRRGIVVR